MPCGKQSLNSPLCAPSRMWPKLYNIHLYSSRLHRIYFIKYFSKLIHIYVIFQTSIHECNAWNMSLTWVNFLTCWKIVPVHLQHNLMDRRLWIILLHICKPNMVERKPGLLPGQPIWCNYLQNWFFFLNPIEIFLNSSWIEKIGPILLLITANCIDSKWSPIIVLKPWSCLLNFSDLTIHLHCPHCWLMLVLCI